MKRFHSLLLLCLIPAIGYSQSLQTVFEQSGGNQTATYFQGISWWKALATRYPREVKMLTMGMTDSGYPLNLVVLSSSGNFDFNSLHASAHCIILVNNAIHPGEPDGVDASMLLARDLVSGKIHWPAKVAFGIIPFYNIGGVLNRGSFSRANQNGPLAYGFRGNAEYLDLNRDFIKSDSRNALAFARIFHLTDPDIFIDNHVSDGADYQHVMTLLTTQPDKLGGEPGKYLRDQMEPGIYALMKARGYDLVPYVNDFRETPDSGWTAYYDSPRYSSGYAALFSTFGFMPETHMLKPYRQRVLSDYALMASFLDFASDHCSEILAIRRRAKQNVLTQEWFPLSWQADPSKYTLIDFKGYASAFKPSEVSGLPRLYYDRSKPYEKMVPFHNTFLPMDSVSKPDAYILSGAWGNLIDILKASGVLMTRFSRDTLLVLEAYHIDSYQSATRPYEKHHFNYNVKLSVRKDSIQVLKGDYFIPMDQVDNRYLVETLEPQGPDGFFSWNFFDAILQRKEGFSGYVFEDMAAKFLQEHPDLRDSLDQAKAKNPAMAASASAQLDWVYQQSPWSEPGYLRYPVYRYEGILNGKGNLFFHD